MSNTTTELRLSPTRIALALAALTLTAWTLTPKAALAKKPVAKTAKTAKAATKAAPVKAYQRSWMTAEDLRLGDFRAPPPPYAFPMLSDDKAKEVYVDSAGRLYKERKYSGVVPNWRTRKRMRRGRCRVQDQKLTWIGFQNAFNSSRVFIQVDGQACGYVYRPDAKHIVIDLPAVSIDNSNFKRDILTGAFPSAVAMVHVSSIEDKGTRVTIALKEPRRYLSAHLGRYLFVDVAR